MSFKEILKTSIYKFSNYPQLLRVSNLKTAVYVFFLAFIMIAGILLSLSPLLFYEGGVGGLLQQTVPEFEIKDGRLSCDKYTFNDPEYGLYVLIDTSTEGELTEPEGYSQVIMANSTHLLSKDSTGTQVAEFSDMPDCSKTTMLEWLSNNKKIVLVFCLITFAFMFFFLAVALACNMAIYAVVAHIANLCFIRSSLKFGEIFKLAVFSMTFPSLLNIVFALFSMSIGSTISNILVMFYLIKGIVTCKNTDGIIIEVL